MTILDERPHADAPATARTASRVSSTPTATWAFASRLARREVRRRPGRTLLVMLLVIVPVLGMTVASISYRTSLASRDSLAERQFGTADLRLNPNVPRSETADTETEVFGPDSPRLPSGSMTTSFVQDWTPVTVEIDGIVITRPVLFTDVDLSNPITASTVEVTAGRVPAGIGEVLFSEPAAEAFGVGLGDEVRFVRPDMTATIVGVGRDTDSYSNNLIVATGFDRSVFRPGAVAIETLVDVPDSVTEEQIGRLANDFRDAGVGAVDPDELTFYENQTGRELAWGWVAGVVSLAATGIIVAAAFATSARRQLVTIGQLAANGASERLVRRTMGLQGWWTGLLGALLGVGIATLAMVAAHRAGLLERISNSRVDVLSVVLVDLVVIVLTAAVAATMAALIPARSAARVPVLAALAGRRPVASPPSWMAPVGVAAFLIGLLLLGASASVDDAGDFEAILALAGSLLVLVGIVCASPLIVAVVGEAGSRRGGVIRLAARSLGRSRARSAAVLTAIATIGALATIGATVAEAARSDVDGHADYSEVSLFYSGDPYGPGYEAIAATDDPTVIYDPPPVRAPEVPVDIRTGIESILPNATWMPVTQTIFDPPPMYVSSGQELPRAGYDPDVRILGQAMVADPVFLERIDLPDDLLDVLEREGVATLSPYVDGRYAIDTPSGPVEIDFGPSLEALGFDGPPETREERQRAEILSGNGRYGGEVIVSPEFVEVNRIEVGVSGYLIDNPVDLTETEREALRTLRSSFFGSDVFVDDATANGFESLNERSDAEAWYASADSPRSNVSQTLVQLAVIIASLILVLGVIAIGLSLAATESRDERDVLYAVGASPRTLRRVSAAKAWVLTTGAAVVAVPAGYITIFVIARAAETEAPFPFVVAGALLAGVPLIAAGATMVTSALAQRFRPVTYSTITGD